MPKKRTRTSGRESKGSKKRQIQLRRRLILLALVLFAAAAGAAAYERFVPSKKHLAPALYFGTAEGEAAVIADGIRLDAKGFSDEGEIYLPYEAVQEAFAPWIFYDEEEQKLIVTGALEKETFPVNDGQTAGKEALISGDQLYVSRSFLETSGALWVRTDAEPARVSVLTKESWPVRTALPDSVIRQRAGIKSPVIRDIEEEETLFLADPEDTEGIDGWTKVFTEDGFSGYIRDEQLEGEPFEKKVPLSEGGGAYTRRHMDGHVNMVFHQTDSAASNAALETSLEGVRGINVIAPTWFYLEDTEGGIRSHADASYVERAHEAGLMVWAVLNDFDGGISSAAETARALRSDTTRSAIVDAVMAELEGCGADGLNIDLELVSRDCVPLYLELLRELAAACRREGLCCSVDTYVPAFTAYLNRGEQARVADYVVLMCYDEHTAGSDRAGSVSSIGFVREGISAALSEVPADQLIAALPFYTRLWQTEGERVESRALGMQEAAKAVAAQNISLSFDEESGQYYGEKEEGSVLWQIWMEDSTSLELKVRTARDFGLAGIAAWKLGLQDNEIWDVLSEDFGA